MSISQKPQLNSYSFSLTADGSPTVEMSENGVSEKMHHSEGAFSESLYIYHEAMRRVTEAGWPLTFLSVGLGLGFNEMILAGHMVKNGDSTKDFHLESFEADEPLREYFKDWVIGRPLNDPRFEEAYETILKLCAEHFQVPPQKVKNFLCLNLETEKWLLKGAFGASECPDRPFSGILYDAFSAKMSPALWGEEALKTILSKAAGPHCVFTTYAATGALNRALKSQGFVLEPRPGFAWKRQSTLATKTPK